MGRNLALVACAALLALAPGRSNAAQTYTVKKGDTLGRIARTLHVDAEALKDANGLQSNLIQPGVKLKVPKQPAKKRSEAKKSPQSEGSADARPESRNPEPEVAREAVARSKEPAKSSSSVSHVVKKGETLSTISDAFDVPVKELRRLNGLDKRARLKPGMTLVVKRGEKGERVAATRRTAQKTYVVQKGDSVFRIAKKFHIQTADLKRLNGLSSDGLKVGQRIVVEEHVVAQKEDDSDAQVTACKLDEAKISDELQELNAEARREGTKVSVTDRVMQVAQRMLGIPYRFGGSTMRGIDCSAYVQKVFRFLNLPLPRTAREQYAVGKEVSKDELATGDLVFFRTYARYPSHVGIYLGDSKFIHASSVGKKVTIDSLDAPFYSKRFIGAKRMVEEEEGAQKAAATPLEDTAG